MTCHHLLCQVKHLFLISFQLCHLVFQLLHLELLVGMPQFHDIYALHIFKNEYGGSFLSSFDLSLIPRCSRFLNMHFGY